MLHISRRNNILAHICSIGYIYCIQDMSLTLVHSCLHMGVARHMENKWGLWYREWKIFTHQENVGIMPTTDKSLAPKLYIQPDN